MATTNYLSTVLGWGEGRHPCIGMRWAKLQQNINIIYFLAKYKWTVHDGNIEARAGNTEVSDPGMRLDVHCKYVLRQNA